MTTELTYYIFEGVLTGRADGKFIHILALSGGGGGSTRNTSTDATNNPYAEGQKTTGTGAGHVHGGPIPPGSYQIATPAHHHHLGLAAHLTNVGKEPYGRSGFYIHTRGTHGSDGCIVPLSKSDFETLMASLSVSHGGKLFVLESMGGSAFA